MTHLVDITGIRGYKINRSGEVYTPAGLKRKTCFDKYGYERVNIRNNGKRTNYFIHRLLAIAFIPNPENKPIINHINGNRADNRLENLEWVTYAENVQDGFKRGRMGKSPKGEKSPHHILKAKDIPTIRKMLNQGKTCRYIGDLFGVSISTIYSIKSRKNWNHVL